MSLLDAKRVFQWNVVMEALIAAGVDAEITAMVEGARQAGDTAQALAAMLLGSADTKQTRNYVKFEVVGMISPFERAYVELTRAGGKTSHELREMLRAKLTLVRSLLAEGPLQEGLCKTVVVGIDELLTEEAP